MHNPATVSALNTQSKPYRELRPWRRRLHPGSERATTEHHRDDTPCGGLRGPAVIIGHRGRLAAGGAGESRPGLALTCAPCARAEALLGRWLGACLDFLSDREQDGCRALKVVEQHADLVIGIAEEEFAKAAAAGVEHASISAWRPTATSMWTRRRSVVSCTRRTNPAASSRSIILVAAPLVRPVLWARSPAVTGPRRPTMLSPKKSTAGQSESLRGDVRQHDLRGQVRAERRLAVGQRPRPLAGRVRRPG